MDFDFVVSGGLVLLTHFSFVAMLHLMLDLGKRPEWGLMYLYSLTTGPVRPL